jgi:hypothetical protein
MISTSSHVIHDQLEKVRHFYDAATKPSIFSAHYRSLLAKYSSYRLHPRNRLRSSRSVGSTSITGVDLSERQIDLARARVPHGIFHATAVEFLVGDGILNRKFDYIILSDLVNLGSDVQQILQTALQFAVPDTRLVINFYNTLGSPILHLATALSLKSGQPVSNWLSSSDMYNLLGLSGWEVVHQESRLLVPILPPVIGPLINRFIAPFFPFLCLVSFQTARVRQEGAIRRATSFCHRSGKK